MRLLLLLALVAPVAAAQPADTLDWRRYYPLAVGNVWEYHDAEGFGSQFRYTIVSDTVVGGRTYYRQRYDRAEAFTGDGGPDTLRSTAHAFIRYDEGGGVVGVPSLEADTVRLRPCDGNFQRDLRLGFGARVACDPPPEWRDADSVFVYGEYDREWRPSSLPGTGPHAPVAVAAVKNYAVGAWFSSFVADVGPVGAGNLWGPALHYAVVGGVEYGAPGFVVASEPARPAPAAFEVRVRGNPSQGGAAFDVRARSPRPARLAVYDALGREVWASEVVVGPDWRRAQVPAAALAPGRYVLTVSGSGERTAAPFTVVH